MVGGKPREITNIGIGKRKEKKMAYDFLMIWEIKSSRPALVFLPPTAMPALVRAVPEQ